MVEVTIFFEGGASEMNTNSEASNNTPALREAFNKLFNSGLSNQSVQIVTRPIGSISNHKNISIDKGNYLLVDLDAPKTEKEKRLDDNYPSIKEQVHFMVQRMEAWILSQSEKVEEVLSLNYERNQQKPPLSQHEYLAGKHPEEISEPDKKLHYILGQYFSDKSNGREKKLKYGKLKTSPSLIEALDIHELRTTFSDVDELLTKIDKHK